MLEKRAIDYQIPLLDIRQTLPYHIRSVDVGWGQYGALLLCQLGTRTLAGDSLPKNCSAAAASTATESTFWAAAATAKAATNSGATTQGAIPCLGKESFLERKKRELIVIE